MLIMQKIENSCMIKEQIRKKDLDLAESFFCINI